MTAPATSAPRWFSIDSDHDISADVVQFSLDQVIWANGTFGVPPTDVVAQAALQRPIQQGRLRYWFYIRMGPGNTLVPQSFGKAQVHGRITDTPDQYDLVWEVYFKYE